MTIRTSLVAIAALTGAASASFTVLPQTSMTNFGANFDALPLGTGIPNENFKVVGNATEGIEIGLKAEERFVGLLPRVGDRYDAQPGTSLSSTNLLGSTWNYVAIIDLGTATLNDYQVTLRLDFDPAPNSASFATLDYNAFALLQGGPSALNVSQFGDSQNSLFNFWQTLGGSPFDPFADGEYEIELEVSDGTGVVALSDIVVRVPTPASAVLLAGGLVAAGRRRR